jgi:hypothetical protein
MIDELLELQERIIRYEITKIPEFSKLLNFVVDIRAKTSDTFFKLLDS